MNGDEVHIIAHSQRIDLGYKIPEIRFDTGSREADLETAANFLAQKLRSLQNRTGQERTEDEWNQAIRSTLLADHTNIFVLNPSDFKLGKISIIEQDNITAESRTVSVTLTPDEGDEQKIGDIFYMEFNLLSKLQQVRFTAPPEIKTRIENLINDYLHG